MTQQELTLLKNEILDRLELDSKLIEDLSPVTLLENGDLFEINGGRHVSFATLRSTLNLAADHQSIYGLELKSGTFSAVNYNPATGAATANIPTTTTHISEGTRLYFTEGRAQAALSSHTGNSTIHITADERTAWNAKLDASIYNTFKSGYDTWKASIDSFVTLFDSMFEKESDGSGGWRIRAKYGLYTNSFLSARGLNAAGGSGGGATQLRMLTDVLINDSALTSGQALVFNGTKWVNQAIDTGLDVSALAAYLTANSYAKTTDIPSLTGYATETWVNQQGFLTGHQTIRTLTIQKNGTNVDTFNPTATANKTINITDVASAATLASHTGDTTAHITAAERTKWNKTATDLAAILGTDTDTIINKWEEVVAFLDTYTEADTLAGLLGNKADKAVQIIAGTGLTGGGTLAADRTLSLATSGVTAGTYTKLTVDTYGRATAGASLVAADIPSLDWSKITSGKPTTLAGYGITNVYTKTEADGKYVTLATDQTISGMKAFSGHIEMGTNHYIYGEVETSGSMLHFDGTRTIVGSAGATTTAATHLRSITGHLTVGSSSAASYDVLDTGNYTTTLDARYLQKSVIDDLFEKVNVGTASAPVWAIKAKYGFYSVSFISARGVNANGGGSGGSWGLMRSWPATAPAATTTDAIGANLGWELRTDLASLTGRVTSLEGGSALTVTTTGSGNAVTAVNKTGTTVTVTKGTTFLTSHQALDYINVADIRNTSPAPNAFADRKVTAWFNNQDKPSGDSAWYSGLTIQGWQSSNYIAWQIASTSTLGTNDNDPNLYFRTGAGATWNSWRKVLDTGNYGDILNGLYLPSVVYNYTNGLLVRLKAVATSAIMVTVIIEGNSYAANNFPIHTMVQFYNYTTTDSIIAASATHFGADLGDIKAFNYDGRIYLWFAQPRTYCTIGVRAFTHMERGNQVESISNAAMPTENVTRLITITAKDKYLPLLTGGTLTGPLGISGGYDAKLILNNTDTEDKYQYISFRQNGTEYGVLGTFGTTDLRWNRHLVVTAANYASIVTQLGTATVGNASKPIYLNNGVPTAGTYTFGFGNGNAAVFCNFPSYAALKEAGFLTADYGSTSYGHPDDVYFKALCKWLIATYPNGGTFMGHVTPNSTGYVHIHLYNSGKGSDGAGGTADGADAQLPTHCSGVYYGLGGHCEEFHCYYGVFNWLKGTYYGTFSGNATTATTLKTTRTIWGQSFNGSGNVSGNMTEVGNITGSGSMTVTANGTLTFNSTTSSVRLKPNNVDAQSVVLDSTSFRPFSAANGNVNLGLTGNRWSNVYSVLGNFSGLITASAGIKIGDVTITYDAAKKGLKVSGGGLYSESYISARGVSGTGGSSSGGGASYNRLDAWADYTTDKSGYVLSAALGNDLNTRLQNVYGKTTIDGMLAGYAKLASANNLIHNSNEFTFIPAGYTGSTIWINYRAGSGDTTATQLGQYNFGNGTKGGYADIVARAFKKTGGTSSQFLKADGSVDSTAYLPKSGGEIESYSAIPLTLKSMSSNNNSALKFKINNEDKGYVGYISSPANGIGLMNYACNTFMGLKDDGTPHVGNKKIWYEDNDGAGSGLDADTLDGMHASAFKTEWNANAGGAFIGWIKIAQWDVTTATYFSPNNFLLQVYRNYNYPAPETYTLSFSFGWNTANIVQLNANHGVRIIEQFRITKSSDSLHYYLEMYVNTNNSTYQNTVNLCVAGYRTFTATVKNEVQTESNLTVLASITTKKNCIVSDLSGSATYAGGLRDSTYHTLGSRRTSANINFDNDCGLHYFLATTSMSVENGKPSCDAHIIHAEWDNTYSWAGQLALPTTIGANVEFRQQNGTQWQAWKKLAFITDNVASATKLADNSEFKAWGQTFFANGKPANISGDLTSVGNITGAAAVTIKATGEMTLNGTTGVYIKYNNDDTKSVVLNSAAFKPFDAATHKLTLGSASAVWERIYGRYIDTDSGYNLRLCTAGTERITIDQSNGYVGFGTTSPAYLVDINGSVRATSMVVNSITSPTNTWLDIKGSFGTALYANGNVGVVLTKELRLGVGTQTPEYKADIAGALRATTAVYTPVVRSLTGQLALVGNSGIAVRCEIAGYEDEESKSWWFSYDGYGYLQCDFEVGGELTIGSATLNYNTTNKGLHCNKGFYSDSYVSARGMSTTSDMRLKRVVSDLALKVEDIAKAPLFVHEWKDGGDGLDFGTSAQYWEGIVPQAVLHPDDYLQLQYGKLGVALGIVNSRELLAVENQAAKDRKRIKALERRVRELEMALAMRN